MRCPFCGYETARPHFGAFARPPGRESLYAELYRCPRCRLWFAPRTDQDGQWLDSTLDARYDTVKY